MKRNITRRSRIYEGTVPLILALVACSPMKGTTQFTDLARTECPKSAPASYVTIDVSGTGRSPQLLDNRVLLTQTILQATAACNGHARVTAFSASSSATQILLDETFDPVGATRNARLRRVPQLVERAMDSVKAGLKDAISLLPGDGSDPVAQFRMVHEYATEFPGHSVMAWILSDGIATRGSALLNSGEIDEATGRALADRTAVPNLKTVAVIIAGIGRTVGKPPPSDFVAGLDAFYSRLCERSGARCLVVTDLSPDAIRLTPNTKGENR